eukprot:TRINITY_DN7158_c0_g1_i1.p1 TRINITY_DN7158_c0_g1~~TRINITY_DN7158_c0_g1_i1.p1  ORF type:complete len:139 (-),score=14.44 TRINITY_DN7158_c0_g1_i1:188-604(-)
MKSVAAELETQDVQVVVIGPGKGWVGKYRTATKFSGPIYTDNGKSLWSKLALHTVKSASELAKGKANHYSKTGFVSGMWWSASNTQSVKDVYEQGAVFVVSAANEVKFVYIEKAANDHPSLTDVFAAAGVSVVETHSK